MAERGLTVRPKLEVAYDHLHVVKVELAHYRRMLEDGINDDWYRAGIRMAESRERLLLKQIYMLEDCEHPERDDGLCLTCGKVW